MAIRVRKLAKELRRSPQEVLGLVHAVGYAKYRSIEDMLPDPLVEKVRNAARSGVRPLAVSVPTQGSRRPAATSRSTKDVMSQLVPGVVPLDRRAPAAPELRVRDELPPPPPQRPPPQAEQVDPPAPTAGVDRIHHLEAQRDELLDRCERLTEERDGWAQAHDRLQGQVDALRAQLQALEEAAREAGEAQARLSRLEALPSEALPTTQLTVLLEERGLRGSDEFERALAALASARALGPLLHALRVRTDAPIQRWLGRRLVLVGEADPDLVAPGQAAVVVAPSRAELPSSKELSGLLDGLGQELLLSGLIRVQLVGGTPLWQKLLRDGLDPRVELRFPAVRTRTRRDAEEDVTRTELVVLWGVDVGEDARKVYETSRALLVELPRTGLGEFIRAWREALQSL